MKHKKEIAKLAERFAECQRPAKPDYRFTDLVRATGNFIRENLGGMVELQEWGWDEYNQELSGRLVCTRIVEREGRAGIAVTLSQPLCLSIEQSWTDTIQSIAGIAEDLQKKLWLCYKSVQ